MSGDVVVLRDDDPRVPGLRGRGFHVVAESWGARLRVQDERDAGIRLRELTRAVPAGVHVRELGPDEAGAVADLERRCLPDFPRTPATEVDARDAAAIASLLGQGTRFFGAVAGERLLAVTGIAPGGDRAETDRTCVDPTARRSGLAAAVKAASVLALMREGWRVFGTGGAAVNTGSLAMNARVGYVLTECWLSLAPPD